MKRIGMILTVVLLVGMAWTSSANAAPSWFKVTIDMVGIQTPTLLGLRLTHIGGTFTNQRFKHSGPIPKEMLATALTAFAIDSPIFVFTDPLDGMVPEILQLIIAK